MVALILIIVTVINVGRIAAESYFFYNDKVTTIIAGIAAIFWIVTVSALLIPDQMKSMRLIQIAKQERLSPAQWIPYIRDLHRCEMDFGAFQLSKFDDVKLDVLSALKRSGCIENTRKRDNVLQRGTKPDYHLNGYYITPKLGWLDAVYLDVTIDEKQGICHIYGLKTSTGFVPVAVPFSPLLNVLLFWIPFYDGGYNKKHLQSIRDALESKR